MFIRAASVLAIAAELGALFGAATPIADLAMLSKREFGYVSSCDINSVKIDQFYPGSRNSVIAGTCYTATGQKRDTKLNLNHCLGNVQGNFQYVEDGNFADSCNTFTAYLTNGALGGKNQNYCVACYRADGTTNSLNCIDLNGVVGNVDGKLQCFGYTDVVGEPY
ncbi:uncharacterized protein B0I36DRAFT_335214 [Microdochium trichocladiopsis]|uniref:Cyanovirin-N domain-containing protein n=1 Tax=Microdochium trichocladiopsis TaxID=1682393 RepID=A0A9P9BJF7_9PEZI|nr:uncharacterized protein B0I36DRAFT_335214 [Microdochium trichocladiopsis]KAH7018045.1 hypothetical protein B0I36DRAFT_335214 [Microdochium trichocladiopsis]